MRLQLMLRAEKVPRPNAGWFSNKKPNTFAIVSRVSDIGSVMGIKRHRIQATEVIPASSTPEWATIIIFEHQPGSDERLAIDVFHTDQTKRQENENNRGEHSPLYQGKVHRGAPVLTDAEQVCAVLLPVKEMIHNDDLSLTIKIPKTKDGNIHARVEYCRPDASELAASFKLHLRGHSLLNVRRNVLEKPEYYYEIHRRHQQHTAATPDDSDAWVLVHRSEKKGATNPFWDINFFDVEQFVNHDLSRDLRIRVFDLEVSAGAGRRRTIIGQVTTSSHGLLGAVTNNGNCDLSRAFQLLSMDGKKKVGQIVVVAAEFVTNDNISNDNFSSSTVITTAIAQPLSLSELEIMTPPATPTADSISVITTPTFVSSSANNNNNAFDQVMAFCDLELCVAIDFTKGNGDPNVPGTSHYRSNNNLNDYQWTMATVVETLAAYSERNEYSVWGFGGQYNGQDQPIFLCGQSAKARGTGGIMSAYEATFQTEISFGSSRKLDTIIAAAAQHARKSLAGAEQHDRRSYTVLLVLMIGEDRDILAAKDKLVAANSAPLSIIFLRLPSPGSSPFDPLKLEVYLGNKGCRDFCICQDMKTIVGTRDSEKLSKLIMKGLKQQVPKFFHG